MRSSCQGVFFRLSLMRRSLIQDYTTLVNEGVYGKVATQGCILAKNGPNIIPRDLVKALQAEIPEIVLKLWQTNTHPLSRDRDTRQKHRETLQSNGWTFCPSISRMSMAM